MFKFDKRKMKIKFLGFIFLNLIVTFIIVYHEKILNCFDQIQMPINDDICKEIPTTINRRLTISTENLTLALIEKELKGLKLSHGGILKPRVQKSVQKVAIIIPYRDREINLRRFLLYMHQFLANQQIQYGIYLVEPLRHLQFNRAQLMNIGFVESQKENEWDCFVFHDIDLLPENDLNFYQCNTSVPKQMAIAISVYTYSVEGYFKEKYFGGVNAFTKRQFELINGFSNSYFGWGIEDDDARFRVLRKFPVIDRLAPEVGRYFANCHEKQTKNPDRFILYMKASSRMETDGLNSLSHEIVSIQKSKLFTRIYVSYKDNK